MMVAAQAVRLALSAPLSDSRNSISARVNSPCIRPISTYPADLDHDLRLIHRPPPLRQAFESYAVIVQI
jgi:hypothetical protein